MPSEPLEFYQVSVLPPKETIHGKILWSKAFVDKNAPIDLVNAMMLAEVVFHILQQGPTKGTPSFETLNHFIRNI